MDLVWFTKTVGRKGQKDSLPSYVSCRGKRNDCKWGGVTVFPCFPLNFYACFYSSINAKQDNYPWLGNGVLSLLPERCFPCPGLQVSGVCWGLGSGWCLAGHTEKGFCLEAVLTIATLKLIFKLCISVFLREHLLFLPRAKLWSWKTLSTESLPFPFFFDL